LTKTVIFLLIASDLTHLV